MSETVTKVYAPVCQICGWHGTSQDHWYGTEALALEKLEEHFKNGHPWFVAILRREKTLEKIAEAAFELTAFFTLAPRQEGGTMYERIDRIQDLRKELESGGS